MFRLLLQPKDLVTVIIQHSVEILGLPWSESLSSFEPFVLFLDAIEVFLERLHVVTREFMGGDAQIQLLLLARNLGREVHVCGLQHRLYLGNACRSGAGEPNQNQNPNSVSQLFLHPKQSDSEGQTLPEILCLPEALKIIPSNVYNP